MIQIVKIDLLGSFLYPLILYKLTDDDSIA